MDAHDRRAAGETSGAGAAGGAAAGAGRVRTEQPKWREWRCPGRQGGGGAGVRAVHPRQRRARLPRPGRQRAIARRRPRAARQPDVPSRDGDLPPKAARRRRPSMRPKLLITGAAVVILGGTVAGLALAWGSAAKEPPAKPALPPATAKVTRTTLVETKKVSGTLGYGDAVPVSAAQTGTLTWIAPEGSTVKRGEPLFKLDERPVVELYGSLPLYRTLRVGVEGTDVNQFEENLSKLGYTGFTVDDTYTAATAQAARSWQADLGLPKTGAVEPGQLVVIPGAVRVAEHTARVGERIGGDTGGGASVLSYTGTTRLVTVELEVADQALAAKSRTVTVTVPGQGPVKGKIAQVGTVATAPEQTGNAPGDQASNAPGGSSSTAPDARIQVTATIADQKKLGSLDGAPVDVDFVSQEREDVLAVPVAALLALPKGGYGVQIVQGGATRIVAVKTGMFAAGRVEISGDGIAEGVTVGMPK